VGLEEKKDEEVKENRNNGEIRKVGRRGVDEGREGIEDAIG